MRPLKSKLNLETSGPTLAILQSLVSETTAIALRSREAHWNVKGPNFGPLHELFGDFYDFTNDWADTLAERIVQQGGIATALTTPIAPLPTVGDESALLQELTGAANHLCEQLHLACLELDPTGDESTKDMLIEFNRDLEKWVWKIESHLQEFQKVGTAKSAKHDYSAFAEDMYLALRQISKHKVGKEPSLAASVALAVLKKIKHPA